MTADIIFLDESTITLGDIDFSCLEAIGKYQAYPNSTEEQIIERMKGVPVCIANKAPMTRKVMDALDALKCINVIATGYNNVDLTAAADHGITVCNVSGYAKNSVPQHVFALILNLATRAWQYNEDIMQGRWGQSSSFTLLTYPTFELAGKTIGIIGFGCIGRQVARIARTFNMNILAYDEMLAPGDDPALTDLDTLLQQSDVITLHCPLTEQTKNLIDEKAFTKTKRSALLINTARGGIINEQALADALNNNRIAGAGFDVLTNEPPKHGNVLLQAKNIILTPHSAWSTVEARQILVDESARNIQAFRNGTPRNVVC